VEPNSSLIEMGSCLVDSDCHDKGECVNYICQCEQYIAGDHCEITFAQELGVGFVAFRIVFIILFASLGIFTAVQLYRISREGSLAKLRGICLCFTMGHTTLRFLYFAIDPLSQTHDVPYVLEQFIFYFGFFCITSSYLVAVLFWVDMYHGRVQKGRVLVKKTKYLFIGLDTILIIISIIQSLAYSGFVAVDKQPLLLNVYNFYLAAIAFTLSSVMMVYGMLVYYKKKNFSRQFRTIQNDMTKIVKLTSTLLIISATIFMMIILLILTFVFNLNATPKGAILAITIAYVIEFTLDVEMLFLMTPRASSSSSSSSSSSTLPTGSGSGSDSATSPSDVEQPNTLRRGLELGTLGAKESSSEEESSDEVEDSKQGI